MSSPKARRRQRSTRLTLAVVLVLTAAVVVTGAVLAGSWGLLAGAAALSVVLGGAATRITHSELMQARRDANCDRAQQARVYGELAAARSVEHAAYASMMDSRAAAQRLSVEQLEGAFSAAQHRAAETARKLAAEQRRVEELVADGEVTARRLEDAETRAAEAIVRVAELEAELDTAHAEISAAHAALEASRAERDAANPALTA